MHRFHLPPAACGGATLVLTGPEAHHALHGVRVHAGDRVTVLDGAGTELRCEVTATRRHEVDLAVHGRETHAPSPCQITLLQAIPKARSMDWIIQKATELGAARIVPLESERSVVHLEADQGERRVAKWTQVAVESIKQCGLPWLPVIEPPVTLAAFLARREPFDVALVGALQPGARHPRACLPAPPAPPPRTVAVWIGPEGDFTPAELEQVQAAGALPITLGPRVLRSDTAALYCLAILSYELQVTL